RRRNRTCDEPYFSPVLDKSYATHSTDSVGQLSAINNLFDAASSCSEGSAVAGCSYVFQQADQSYNLLRKNLRTFYSFRTATAGSFTGVLVHCRHPNEALRTFTATELVPSKISAAGLPLSGSGYWKGTSV
uniref:Transferrin-like domain-containing protein n=1 Tax=Macrostomum lignano TaxID=282301 RepID=A0A1I8GES3_9PLAT